MAFLAVAGLLAHKSVGGLNCNSARMTDRLAVCVSCNQIMILEMVSQMIKYRPPLSSPARLVSCAEPS